MKTTRFTGFRNGEYVGYDDKVDLPMDDECFDTDETSKCPYCGAFNNFEAENESDGDNVEIECNNCEKFYEAEFMISWSVSEGQKIE
ncbi:hypothetical protein D0502_02075 [Leuconostoc falkenbergense]|jgi:hypothetical protein|uniref:Uncharacterized protein n=1 Tax=Leuconostoc falkenbergense TaxID=2766470 RepID=A0A9X3E7P3_9LACO|nr:hypothetical protein [Leuconostoc falkenbergense]MCX7578188.1 hypothetical protein [Leuconostoc falkenbergense]